MTARPRASRVPPEREAEIVERLRMGQCQTEIIRHMRTCGQVVQRVAKEHGIELIRHKSGTGKRDRNKHWTEFKYTRPEQQVPPHLIERLVRSRELRKRLVEAQGGDPRMVR